MPNADEAINANSTRLDVSFKALAGEGDDDAAET